MPPPPVRALAVFEVGAPACSSFARLSGRVARSRIARCKEDPLLQHEEPPLGVDGDDLEWDQDRLHPEKSHLDLRVLSPAAPIQEEPLQLPDLPSLGVTDPVTCALLWLLEPFDGPRASRRHSGCRLRHCHLAPPWCLRGRLLVDALALMVLT